MIPKSLLAKGVEAFGSEKLLKAWLNQTNIALGDKKPIELLESKEGTLLVESRRSDDIWKCSLRVNV